MDFSLQASLLNAADPADHIQTQNNTAAKVGPLRLVWQAPYTGANGAPRVPWQAARIGRIEILTSRRVCQEPHFKTNPVFNIFKLAHLPFLKRRRYY